MASILLFDDDIKTSKSIEQHLEKMGNNVVVINNLDDLEEKISQIEDTDIIIMDVVCHSKKLAQKMGIKEEYVGPYGIIFVNEKWGNNKKMLDKIILMSSWEDPWIENTAKKIECPLFQKPFQKNTMLDYISQKTH